MRLLVIANSCLSEEESNGRILRTLLNAFSNEELSNFALRGIPNCQGVDYLTVTDHDALRSFVSLGIKKPHGIVLSGKPTSAPASNSSSKARNHCIRDVVWFSNFWKRGHVKAWFRNLNIDAVFLMAADAPFLYRLAYKVSKEKKIPLIIYSSEDYFLKNYNYMERKTSMNLWCRLFLRKLHKEARKAFSHASLSMLCSKKLENSVKAAYGDIPTEVINQPSTLNPIDRKSGPIKSIVYGGNVAEDRLHALKEIAEVIHAHNPALCLDVYGGSSKAVEKELKSSNGIRYHGKVPYEELLSVYKDTDILVHAESFNDYHLLDYAHAFSTKIGDCYISGIPFFLYGPKEIPCIQFAYEACPSYTATGPEEVKQKLIPILDGHEPYQIDRKFIESCFDATLVGERIKALISDQIRGNR